MNGNHYEEVTQGLIDQAVQEQRDLQSRREAIDRELQRVENELIAFQTTLQAYRRKAQLPTQELEEKLALELKRLTQLRGLVLLAERSGGTIRTKEAARLLHRVGKISNPKNAYSIIQHLLADSGRFESIGNGTYRLLHKSEAKVSLRDFAEKKQSGKSLGKFLLATLRERPKNLDTLKREAQIAGLQFGSKHPGRVIHYALVGMAQNRLVERINGLWMLKS